MNIHPIFVHFPIALLTFYCLLEFLRFRKILSNKIFFYIKLFLLVFGTFSIFLALQTGNMAKKTISGASTHLVNVHSNFAVATAFIFCILALSYVIEWFNIDFPSQTFAIVQKFHLWKIWRVLSIIAKLIIKSKIVIFLALIGLIVITITGALGASIVYGPGFDPIIMFIYKLFVI